jgi:hypothetical protein
VAARRPDGPLPLGNARAGHRKVGGPPAGVAPPLGFTPDRARRPFPGSGPGLVGVQPFTGPPPGWSPFRSQVLPTDNPIRLSPVPMGPRPWRAGAADRSAPMSRKRAMVARKQRRRRA